MEPHSRSLSPQSGRNRSLCQSEADIVTSLAVASVMLHTLLLLTSKPTSPLRPSHSQWRAKVELPRCSCAIKMSTKYRVSPDLLQRRELSLQLQSSRTRRSTHQRTGVLSQLQVRRSQPRNSTERSGKRRNIHQPWLSKVQLCPCRMGELY
jgi:hypothetical protein